MRSKLLLTASCVALMLSLTACVQNSQDHVIGANKSQVALRAIQAKAFDTTNQEKTLRTIIATLQDLGFVINKADLELGTVSGTKLAGYAVQMTVSTRPMGKRTVVRANATFIPAGGAPRSIESPKPYQEFFASLEKSMFLTAHDVE